MLLIVRMLCRCGVNVGTEQSSQSAYSAALIVHMLCRCGVNVRTEQSSQSAYSSCKYFTSKVLTRHDL